MSQNTDPFVLRWGILSTGLIAGRFVSDLVKDSAARGAPDVTHKISAVASRSLDKAQSFIKQNLRNHGDIRPLGSYEEMYNDPDVDVVYIGTPHSHHYRNAKDALLAGKPILLEKPCTVTAEQLIELVDIARRKRLFFMEAVWTRFFPVMYEIQNRIHNGEIGRVTFVEAQFCKYFDKVNSRKDHRMVVPSLAGGSLLDQGTYPWTWIAMTLHHPQPGSYASLDFSVPKDIKANQVLSSNIPGEMIDDSTIATWTHNGAIAVMKSSICAESPKEIAVLVTGTKGQIILTPHSPRPNGFTIRKRKEEQNFLAQTSEPETHEYIAQEFPDNMAGYGWEADEVARCMRDGKLESERMPLNESIQMMKVLDEIRKQGGLKYPPEIESVDPK